MAKSLVCTTELLPIQIDEMSSGVLRNALESYHVWLLAATDQCQRQKDDDGVQMNRTERRVVESLLDQLGKQGH